MPLKKGLQMPSNPRRSTSTEERGPEPPPESEEAAVREREATGRAAPEGEAAARERPPMSREAMEALRRKLRAKFH